MSGAGTDGMPSQVETLSLGQAIDRALAASRELRQAERDVEVTKIKKDETWKTYEAVLINTHIPGTEMYVAVPSDRDPAPGVYKTDYDWRLAKKTLEAKKDTVVRQVYEKYYAVVQAESALEAARLDLESSSLALKAAEARYMVGMESELSLASVRAQHAGAKAAVAAAEGKLAQAYADLNLLLGKPAGWWPRLTDRPAYSALEVANPEAEISRIAAASPAVWAAEEAVKLQRNIYGMVNSYELDRVNLAKAYENAAVTREQTEQAVQSLYHTVKNLEASRATAEAAVTSAREALRVRELMYRVGMATPAEVAAARASLAKAEDNLLTLTAQHELAKMSFFEPWATGGSQGGGAAAGGSNSSAAGSR